MCLFSNITSHRNRLMLLMEHLAMRILTRKYIEVDNDVRSVKKFFGIQEVFLSLRKS
jgi:hypothetical protein